MFPIEGVYVLFEAIEIAQIIEEMTGYLTFWGKSGSCGQPTIIKCFIYNIL